jgi:hypothetical protein
MKTIMKTILITATLFFVNMAFGQTYDQRLEPYFAIEDIQKMIREDIQQYKFLLNALNKGIFISDIPQEKASSIEYNGELNIDPEEKHTFLSLGLDFTDLYQYYRITGTEKMLVVLPKSFLEPKQ